MHRLGTLVGLTVMAVASAAHAQDGGASIPERGTPDMGASGAGSVARAEDAGTAHFNAAGMTRLDQSELMAGIVAILPSLKIKLNSKTKSFPAGDLNGGGSAGEAALAVGTYIAIPIEENLWFGFTVNGPYGGAVNYTDDWAGRTFVTDASLLGLNFEPALAYRIDDHWSIGGSVSALYTTLDVEFRAAAPSDAPRVDIDDADDWGFGGSVSVLYEHDERSRLGFRYRSKIDVDLTGDFGPKGETFDFDVDMEMPQSAALGGVYGLSDKVDLLADVSWTDWSEFGYMPATLAAGPGAIPINRDWDDVWRVGAGLQYAHTERTTLRTGIAWTGDPVSDRRRLPDIPVGETWRFSAGLEHDFSETTTIGLTYTLAWMKDMDLDNVELPPQFNTSLNGEFDDSTIHFIGITLAYRF